MKGIGAGKKTKDQVVKENISVFKDIYVKVEQQARLLDEASILYHDSIDINDYPLRPLAAITSRSDPTSPMSSASLHNVASVAT